MSNDFPSSVNEILGRSRPSHDYKNGRIVNSPHQVQRSLLPTLVLTMTIPARSDVIFLGILTVSFATLFVWYSGKKRFPYPPGPRRLPIIGNLFNMPSHEEWVIYRKWSDKFGMTLCCEHRRVRLRLNVNCISQALTLYIPM